jgi:hypothetical protein
MTRKAALARVEKLAVASDFEKQLLDEMAELQKRLEDHQRRREGAAQQLDQLRAEIAKLENSKTLAEADERIANLIWMKLLKERQESARAK